MRRNSTQLSIIIFCFLGLLSCLSQSTKERDREDKTPQYKSSSSNSSSVDNEKNNGKVSNNGDCNFRNDTYSATVDYYNSETNYSNNYTLDVDIEDCQVVKIYFSNGGWLDEDHISPAGIDEDGNATVNGEEGKTYEIHIDNLK